MEKKQTAVQWLIYTMQNSLMEQKEVKIAFEQALQMEREQIEEAYYVGKYEWHKHETKEHYYTQTFKP